MIQFDLFSDSNSVGIVHAENEDSLLADQEDLLFAVADGVGGYDGAKFASSFAVEKLRQLKSKIKDEATLRMVIEEVHRELKKKAKELELPLMGTTIAVAKVIPDDNSQRILCANVGDSPIFLIRNEDMMPLYFDDSERSRNPGNMWSLLSYLGFGHGGTRVHARSVQFENGDILLLCSDGVSDNILETSNDLAGLRNIVRATRSAESLVKSAMETRFKLDDMSAILVFL